MTLCLSCWRKARPKYKQHILALFPTAEEATDVQRGALPQPVSDPRCASYTLFRDPLAQPRNLSDLTYYAQMFPNRLPLIARYLLKLLRQNEHKGGDEGPRLVHVTLGAFQGLVEACHGDDVLVLYDEVVCEAIRWALHQNRLEHRIMGAQLLVHLMSYVDDAADFRKYESFFQQVVPLCLAEEPNRLMRDRLRLAGLQAMQAMTLHFYPTRLAQHYREIIPALLANIVDTRNVPLKSIASSSSLVSSLTSSAGSYPPQHKSPNELLASNQAKHMHSRVPEESMQAVATANDTLSIIAARISIPDLDSVLEPVFQSLNSLGWRPISRCTRIMQLMATASSSDISDLMLSELLKFPLTISTTSRSAPKPSVLSVSSTLISTMRVNVLHWEGMADLLVQHMLCNIRYTNNEREYHELHMAIRSCFAAYAQKLPLPQDVLSLLFHLFQQIYLTLIVQLSPNPVSSSSSHAPQEQHVHPRLLAQTNAQLNSSQLQLLVIGLLECAVSISASWQCDMSAADVIFTTLITPDVLLRAMLACVLLLKLPSSRALVYQAILNLLLPPVNNNTSTGVEDISWETTGDSETNDTFLPISPKAFSFFQRLHETPLLDTVSRHINGLQLSDKDQHWLVTVMTHELTSSIVEDDSILARPSHASSFDSNSTVHEDNETILSHAHQAVSQQLAFRVRDKNLGVTSTVCFSIWHSLLIVMASQSFAANITIQLPVMCALYHVAQTDQLSVGSQRINIFLNAWAFNISRLCEVNGSRHAASRMNDHIRMVMAKETGQADMIFDVDNPQRGLVPCLRPLQSSHQPFQNILSMNLLTSLLTQGLVDPKANSRTNASNVPAADSDVIASSSEDGLKHVFEPYQLKYLIPAKLVTEEREESWAPSKQMGHQREDSHDAHESISPLDTPLHSQQPLNQVPTNTEHPLRASSVSSVSSGTCTTESDIINNFDISFASLAHLCNRRAHKLEQRFRLSLRLLVDDVLYGPQSAERRIDRENHSEMDSAEDRSRSERSTPSSASIVSVDRVPTSASLSARRRSFTGIGINVSGVRDLLSSNAATSDKFFAAPAVAAPPTLNVNAAIRQQIESSYALSPSHAVSGSVNIKSSADDSVSISSVNTATAVHPAMSNVATSSNKLIPQFTRRSTSAHSRASSESPWLHPSFDRQRGASVAEENEDAEVEYALDDVNGSSYFTHIEGTGRNVFQIHFPALRTYTSFLPSEFL